MSSTIDSILNTSIMSQVSNTNDPLPYLQPTLSLSKTTTKQHNNNNNNTNQAKAMLSAGEGMLKYARQAVKGMGQDGRFFRDSKRGASYAGSPLPPALAHFRTLLSSQFFPYHPAPPSPPFPRRGG